MSWAGTTTTTSFGGNFTFVIGAVSLPPLCHACHAVGTLRTPDKLTWCRSCLEANNRRVAIDDAPNWLTAAFAACTPDQRPRLYRSLAALFHPDTGGDTALMQALNAVKERFP